MLLLQFEVYISTIDRLQISLDRVKREIYRIVYWVGYWVEFDGKQQENRIFLTVYSWHIERYYWYLNGWIYSKWLQY